jgi:hypothetical protein
MILIAAAMLIGPPRILWMDKCSELTPLDTHGIRQWRSLSSPARRSLTTESCTHASSAHATVRNEPKNPFIINKPPRNRTQNEPTRPGNTFSRISFAPSFSQRPHASAKQPLMPPPNSYPPRNPFPPNQLPPLNFRPHLSKMLPRPPHAIM